MTETDFIPEEYQNKLEEGRVVWEAPSNIALVKYWGKRKNQIPANPSISFTLDLCRTRTSVSFNKKEEKSGMPGFELYLDGRKEESFEPKIRDFFGRIAPYLPFVKDYHFSIETSNSFPHSSGIASSASGMAALATALVNIEQKLNPNLTPEHFTRKSSFLARLGSGSACRSIEGEIVSWGRHQTIAGSSDLFGLKYPYRVNPVFRSFQDSILLVDQGQKQVSSSLGHRLMEQHPFAAARFEQANKNLDRLTHIFQEGDLDQFVEVVESEALSLHAMMMTSRPYFLLMKPGTLEVIQRVFQFRRDTGLHLCFTLDAGANVHLLYPEQEQQQIRSFIQSDLLKFCQNDQAIMDRVGKGAIKIEG